MSGRLNARFLALLMAVVGLSSAGSPSPPATVDSLWAAEGQTLQDLVAATEGPDRGEALFRLGQWERDSAERLRKTQESGGAPALDASIRAHLDASERAFSDSIPLAAMDRIPQVLFSLGDIRRFRGDPKGAEQPFSRLVHDFPNNPLAVDAALALGDDAFDAARLADAMRRFEFADQHATTSGTHAYARYKLAWCHLNLDEMDVARRLFLEVIQLAESGGQRLSLADEARRDFVLALARDPRMPAVEAQQAIRALKLPEDRTRRYEHAYASIIAGAGRDEEATRLFSSLESHALAVDAVRILTAELEIAVRARNLPLAIAAGNKLGNTLGAFPSAGEDSLREAEKALRVAAVTLHGEGRARGDQTMLHAALGLYTSYFLAFDSSPLAYELHHHAGELLDMLHEPALAERHFTAAVVRDLQRLRAHQAPGKWLAASALGAVNMAQDAMPALDRPTRLAPPGDDGDERPAPEPTPLSNAEKVFVGACDRYIQALPQDSQAVDVAYQRALLLYRHNRLQEAGQELEKIALEHPGDAKAEFAAELSLDALQLLGRYDELAALAVRYDQKRELHEKLGDELQDVHEAALLAAARRESRKGDHVAAARRYLDFVRRYPRATRIDLALFNGAAELTMQGRLHEAVAVRARLMAEHGSSSLAKRAREQQLSDLVHLGRFKEAAPIAASLAQDLKGKDAATHLHDAITVTEAAGDLHGADQLRQRYVKDHRQGPDAMRCALALVDRARGCESQRKAAKGALAIAPDSGWRVIVLERIARIEDRCHQEGSARWFASVAVGLTSRVPAGRADALDALANAELLLVEGDARRYRSLPVAAPYERTLPKKLAALKTLDERLARVVARGRASAAVCALVQSGLAYGELANVLTNASAPRSLTQEQREMFHEQLVEKSQPLLDHAKETLMQAITRAREAKTEPACLRDARRELAVLWPERFGPWDEAFVHLIGPETAPGPESADILTRAPDAPAAWLVAARAELAAHRPQAAFVLADRVQKEDFLYPQALELKARAFELLGESDAAVGMWSTLAQDFPERPLAHRVLADRAMANRDFEAARAHLLALQKGEEKNPDIAINLGVALHALGDLSGAEKAWRDAAKLEPKKLEASLDLGLLLCGDGGRPKEGIQMLEQFSQAGGRAPDSHRFESTLSACRALAGSARP